MSSSPLPDDQSNYPGAVERVFGPPGTGKTTHLSKRIRSTVAKYGAESMLLASFSVTATKEMASRFPGEGPRPHPRCIGTLHSHAFRQLDRPPVALDRRVITDWNSQVDPEWRVTPDTRKSGAATADTGGAADDGRFAASGDELLAAMDRLRATLTPPEDWPPNVRDFATRWSDWKRDAGAVDFSDMISLALERARDGTPPPGRPQFVLIDEAQDLTPLELELALAWGRHESVRKLVFGLDDDQAINRWRGGDPEALLTLQGPGVVDHLLTKSYRVPESVRQAAERWVRRLGSRRRDKSYLPRTVTEQRFDEHGDPYEFDTGEQVQGAAFHLPLRVSDPRLVAKLVADVEAGRTAMVLTACTYMLDPLINNLRREGVPFHNPYRPAEGRWNPLGRSGEGITTTAERVQRYLALAERDWTGADMQSWIELVKLGPAGMRNGAKAAIGRLNANAPVPYQDVADLFLTTEALGLATEPSIDWLSGALLKSKERVAGYPLHIARMHGAAALAEQPRIVVGTIHCSPPDEPVLTTEGYVPIGELMPGTHCLVGYNTSAGLVRGFRGEGASFTRAINSYSGQLFTLATERSRTRVTPDHRVRVAFADSFFGRWVVYLMRRGLWWRVGHCASGHRPYRSGGVGGRLATEQADAGWILGVYDTKREAIMAEALTQARFGIPGLTFEAARGREVASADLHAVHEAAAADVSMRIKVLLDAYGLDEQAPLYARSRRKLNRSDMRATFLTEARNLLPLAGHLLVPVTPEDFIESTGKRWPELLPVTMSVEQYTGEVHSLEVLPHHHYVSGGAVVHNSVKGATADVVYVSPDISPAAARTLRSQAGIDETIRQFYVALTRAFCELRVLTPATSQHVRTTELIPGDLEVFA